MTEGEVDGASDQVTAGASAGVVRTNLSAVPVRVRER